MTIRAIQPLAVNVKKVVVVKGIDIIRLLPRHGHHEGRRIGNIHRAIFDDAEERTETVCAGTEPDPVMLQNSSGSGDNGCRGEIE